MADKIPFLKVYCSEDLRQVVFELAKLTGTSAGAIVRSALEAAQLDRDLEVARAREAARLAHLQQVEANRLGQTDWVTTGAPATEPGRERSERTAGRSPRKRPKKARTKRTLKPAGKRSRGGR
jgi:hypothetical protein